MKLQTLQSMFLIFLSGGFLYIIGNFLLYSLILRDYNTFQKEKGIFLYHFGSLCFSSLLFFIVLFVYMRSSLFELLIIFISLHGIYSLSFLELWSLTQGSYSINILAYVYKEGHVSRRVLIEKFMGLGQDKRISRTQALESLGLIKCHKDIWRITLRGYLLSKFFRCFVFLANWKNIG